VGRDRQQFPGLFAVYLPFPATSQTVPACLETRIKELTRTARCGAETIAAYTTSHRYTAASANGATETDLAAVARGDYSGFTDPRADRASKLAEGG